MARLRTPVCPTDRQDCRARMKGCWVVVFTSRYRPGRSSSALPVLTGASEAPKGGERLVREMLEAIGHCPGSTPASTQPEPCTWTRHLQSKWCSADLGSACHPCGWSAGRGTSLPLPSWRACADRVGFRDVGDVREGARRVRQRSGGAHRSICSVSASVSDSAPSVPPVF